jgi:hypothetical protein
MAEFDAKTTIDAAVEAVGLGMVKKTKEGDREVEYFAPEDLIPADNHASAKVASGHSHFGLRLTKCVPPASG